MFESLILAGSDLTGLRLPDELINHYAETYHEFSAPWKHRVGIDCPTFAQFVSYHEQRQHEERREVGAAPRY